MEIQSKRMPLKGLFDIIVFAITSSLSFFFGAVNF
jgi:hypothetical protein